MVRWVTSIIVLLPVTVVWANFLGGHWQSFKVISRSMEPTLLVNDYLLMKQKKHYSDLDQKVVVLRDPHGSVIPIVKRVVAGPSSIVRVRNGLIYLDGSSEPLSNERVHKTINRQWILDDDEIFALGDNINNSEDSIDLGPFNRDAVMGVIFWRYWPMSRMGTVE